MSLYAALRRFAPLAVALSLSSGLSACVTGLDGFVQNKVEGYDLDQDALAQIRPGQSQKLVVTGTSPTAIRAKVWVDGTEPDAWLWDVTDSTAALQVDGHTGLALSLAPDATNVPLTATFDDFTVVAP